MIPFFGRIFSLVLAITFSGLIFAGTAISKSSINPASLESDLKTKKNDQNNIDSFPENLVLLKNQPILVPDAPHISAASYILIDSASGQILAVKNPHKMMAPASLTKVMTLYVAFTYLAQGTVKLDDKVSISKKAWSTGGSKMFLKLGDQVKLSDLITGITVDSGNDAAIALAEYIAGSVPAFVQLMNLEAQLLNMKNTKFANCDGLPAEKHYSTAFDLAIVARATIKNFPKLYNFYGQKEFDYNNIKQSNRNRLLWRYPGADGLKTGYIPAAGYCLIGSALVDQMRLIAVVLDAPNNLARTDDVIKLFNYGYRFYQTVLFFKKGEIITKIPLKNGKNKSAELGIIHDLDGTIYRNHPEACKLILRVPQSLVAPLQAGKTVGTLILKLGQKEVQKVAVITLSKEEKAGWLRVFFHAILHSLNSLFHSNTHSPCKEIILPLPDRLFSEK